MKKKSLMSIVVEQLGVLFLGKQIQEEVEPEEYYEYGWAKEMPLFPDTHLEYSRALLVEHCIRHWPRRSYVPDSVTEHNRRQLYMAIYRLRTQTSRGWDMDRLVDKLSFKAGVLRAVR